MVKLKRYILYESNNKYVNIRVFFYKNCKLLSEWKKTYRFNAFCKRYYNKKIFDVIFK